MSILLETETFKLTLSDTAKVENLVLSGCDEALQDSAAGLSFFTVTQERPWNNEVKLAHPNSRTVYEANAVRQEGDLLHVSFETVPVKANIRVSRGRSYLLFTLESFTVEPDDYRGLLMDTPPVTELCLCRLPLKNREKYGEWLNVLWDDKAAVCVAGDSPHTRVEQTLFGTTRVLSATAARGLRLKGCGAALIAAEPGEFLAAMGEFEHDLGLPDGAGARLDPRLNRSVYWVHDLCPANVDAHIARAKQGGFTLMLMYYTCFFKETRAYGLTGDYDFNEHYPRGAEDIRAMLAKLRDAGITPGLHILQTFIGLKSRYVTPKADHRLGKKARFTLARAYTDGDTELFVDEDPSAAPMTPVCRVLHFGPELFTYEGYTEERPYRFTGVKRGASDTDPAAHPEGEVGFVLDISEYGAGACYIDQDTDLQDEVAEKLAAVYNLGFEFCYMDGSEGTNAPHAFHVPNAQYRVIKKLAKPPIFTEGAAKAHFSWHFQAGANAFDIFPPDKFKDAIVRFPAAEAPLRRMDFTRLDFGWWGVWAPREQDDGIQADHYEFGTSVAAGWDCPAAIQANLAVFEAHPRTEDLLEVMRRWEDVRIRNLLTEEDKEELRDTSHEHTLLLRAGGAYDLRRVTRLDAPAPITAYLMTVDDVPTVMYWHRRGEGMLKLPCPAAGLSLRDTPDGEALPLTEDGGCALLPAAGKRFLSGPEAEALAEAFRKAAVKE